METLDREQLFRELDAIKTSVQELVALLTAQNGRIRKLEDKMVLVWFGLGAVCLAALAMMPVLAEKYLP